MDGLTIGSPSEGRKRAGDDIGIWWIAGTERTAPGVVEFTSDNHVDLTLMGSLDSPAPGEAHVLHGRYGASETAITVTQASVSSRSGRRFPPPEGVARGQVERWRGVGYVLDGHLDSPDNEEFTTVSFTTPQLAQWWEPPVMDHDADFGEEATAVSVKFEMPAATEVALPGVGSLSVGYWPNPAFHEGRGYLHLDMTPHWSVLLAKPLPLSAIYSDVALPLLLWTTFSSGAADRFSSISLRPTASGAGPRRAPELLRWFPVGWTGESPKEPAASRWRYLVPHEDLGDRLPEVLGAWFALYENAKVPLLDLLMAVLIERSRFPGPGFLRTMAAAEKYHDIFHHATKFADDEWEALSDRLVRATEGREQRGLVRNWLKRGNTLSLSDRLERLLEPASPQVQAIGHVNRHVLKSAARIRNVVAHGEEVTPEMYEDMWAGGTLVTFILRSLILQRIGFDPAEADAMITRTREWRWMEELARGGR